MPDRGRTYGSRSRDLIPGATTTARPNPTDASAGHYWLMRRDLALPIPATYWPSAVIPRAFTLEHAAEVHRLLTLGYSSSEGCVPDYHTWLTALERNPESDLSRCFLAMLDNTVAGVIVCWTSAFIKDLVVHPEHQNKGIGFALLNHLFTHLASPLNPNGEASVDLHVMESNQRARHLYEKSALSYVRRFPVPTS